MEQLGIAYPSKENGKEVGSSKPTLAEIVEINNNRKLKHVLKVGCLCDECKNSEEPHYFEYDSLLEKQRENISTVKCSKSNKPQDIKNLNRISIFAEKNNSGKTSLLESIYLLTNLSNANGILELIEIRSKISVNNFSVIWLRDQIKNFKIESKTKDNV